MNIWHLILSCTLLSLCTSDPTFTMTNSMLDPNRLFWWRTKWSSAPILLSVNNVNQVSTATFFFSPTTAITSGVFEVTFPTGFTIGSGTSQTYSGLVVQYAPVTYTGGQDYQVTITGLTNPATSGAYGPFALRTRYSPNSQQVDVNLAFGSVFIYTTAGTLGSFTVTLAGTTVNNVINKGGNTLSFKFTLGVSLWRYDTFIINTDYRWTIAVGATCGSADYTGRWNNFNGTNIANPHQLDCVLSPQSTTKSVSQNIYIYGLAVDGIDLTATSDNAFVDLRVGSVTTPNAVYTGNPYSWTVSTSRFGTTTILETASFTSGPTVATDVITTATWQPTWGLVTSSIASGSSYFMDLTFSITNPIPAGGQITITVSENISGTDSNWYSGISTNCYIVTYLSSLTPFCTVNTNTITLATLPALAAGASIKVRNIVTFSQSAGSTEQITALQTFDPVNAIDASSGNLASFTLASNTAAVSNFYTLFVASTDTTTYTTAVNLAGGTGTSVAVLFSLLLPATPGFTSSTTASIYCPFTSDIEDFSINVPASSYSFAYTTTAPDAGPVFSVISTSTNLISTTVPTLTTTGNSSTQGNIAFTGNVGQASGSSTVTFTTQLNLLLFSSGSTYLTLPRVVNNVATAYECRVMITTANTVSTVPSYSTAARFLIAPQIFTTSTFSSPCSWYVDGVPAIFSLQPAVLPIPQSSVSGATYYVEVQFTSAAQNFGTASGLVTTPVSSQFAASPLNSAFTTSYPAQSSQTAAVSGLHYYVSSGTSNYVAVSGLAIGTSVTGILTFPIGGFTVATTLDVTPTISSYYILTIDPRYKFITHTSSGGTFTYTATAPGTSITAGVISTSNSGTNGSMVSTALQLGLYGVDTTGGNYVSSYYLYFLLGVGWTWSSSKSILYVSAATSTAFSSTYYFSSPSPTFGYTGVLANVAVTGGSAVANGFNSGTGTTTTISLSGFALPLGVVASSPITVAIGGTVGSSDCSAYSTGSITYGSVAGTITSVTVTPTTIKTQGPDGVNVSHTVSFTLTHGVPAGGSINLTFSNAWTNPTLNPCTYCTTTGLTNGSSGGVTTPVSCVLNSNSVVVTQFADFSTVSSTTTITIVIYGLIAPSSASTSPGTQFVTAITTNIGLTTSTAIIDQATTFTGSFVIVTASSATGNTTWTTKKTYPMSAGTTGVDLYLKFSLTHALPVCGVITISSPLTFLYSPGAVNNWSFLSPVQYTSSVITSSNLAITLGQAYAAGSVLELYLDSAVDNPSSTTTMSIGFAITTSWGGVVVDQDSTSAQIPQTLTATPVLSSAITTVNSGLSFAPTTTGEMATYTFDFKDTVNYALGDQYWIVFPSQFDYFLGNTWVWLTNEPNSYYIDCNSSQLGTTWCTVNHNIVVVWGANAITGSTEIVININRVINPAPAQTSNFQIFHVSSTGSYLTITQNFGTVTPTAYPANLYIRSLVQSDNRLFQTASYTWRLYILDTMNTDSQLQVEFPQEFDLSKFDSKSSYSCVSTWLDDSAGAVTTTQQNWNSASSCSASGNWITLPPPATQVTFTSTSIVTWTIQGVVNNQWGQPRVAQNSYTDFDVQDSALWPLYPYWVSKFTFFVYRSSTSNLFYSSRSYPNTNAAYTGFYDGYRPLYVNNYAPQTKLNRIIVYAGTQTSDIYISTAGATSPISAKQITLTPTTNPATPDNGKLKYTSVTSNWILFQAYWQIQFRVAAAIDLIKGLYYINWANNELKQTGLTDVQYDPPVSTLVEVIASTTSQYSFAVAAVPNIITGFISVPIKVSITNAPHADATVNISVSGNPANISVNPTSLTFGPDLNALYFQVSVTSNYELSLGTSQSLAFSITGTDAIVYTITPSLKFTITQTNTTIVAGNVVSWGLGTATKTMETATPSTDQVGVIYYQLSAAGTTVPSFSTLKASVGSLLNTNSTSSTTSSLGTSSSTPSQTTESDPATGETWTQFQYRLYKSHLEQVWVGSLAMVTTTASTTLTFNWLFAATQYQLCGYLDNLSPSTSPTVHTENFTTTAIASPQPFTIAFTGNVAPSFGNVIAQEAANVQGVNPLRLGNATYTQITSRRLDTSTIASTNFEFVLVPNRFSEAPDPSAEAQITGAGLTTLAAKLQSDGISNTLNSVTNNAVPTRVVPAWTAAPTSGSATVNVITVTLRANTAGQACCVALTSSAVQPTPEQVMLGLDPTNAAASNACTASDLTKTTNSVQIMGLQAATTYFAFCTAMDNYPLWPTQMSYSATNPMAYFTITTLHIFRMPPFTSASYFGGLFLLLALLLH